MGAAGPGDSTGLWLGAAAGRWAERTALVFGEERLSYAELAARQDGVAAMLLAHGLEPGERVLWQLPNSALALAMHYGILRAGAVSVPVPMLYREHEMTEILRDARPAIVVGCASYRARRPAEEMAPLLDALGVARRARLSDAPTDGWDAIGDAPPGALPPPPGDGDEHATALVMYTSGSTALPKGVMHSRASLRALAQMLTSYYAFSTSDAFITGAPVTHIAGLIAMAVLPSTCGGKAILLPGWDATVAADLADREEATFSCGATVFLQGYVDEYERSARRHPLKMFMCGGAAIPPELILRSEAVGVSAFRSWGMTEAPMVGVAAASDPMEVRAGTDGRICPGGEVEAVDGDRRPLAVGQTGELRVRAPQMFIGYTNETLNAEQRDAQGWYYSGDAGFVDERGCLTMTGRIKDIINRGGEKFSAQDIENAIASHPAVEMIAVVGVDDKRLGEEVAGFVVLRPDTPWPGREALIGHLEAQRLAKQKIPRIWRVIEEMPLTASGKIQKEELRNRWRESLQAVGEPD